MVCHHEYEATVAQSPWVSMRELRLPGGEACGHAHLACGNWKTTGSLGPPGSFRRDGDLLAEPQLLRPG